MPAPASTSSSYSTKAIVTDWNVLKHCLPDLLWIITKFSNGFHSKKKKSTTAYVLIEIFTVGMACLLSTREGNTWHMKYLQPLLVYHWLFTTQSKGNSKYHGSNVKDVLLDSLITCQTIIGATVLTILKNIWRKSRAIQRPRKLTEGQQGHEKKWATVMKLTIQRVCSNFEGNNSWLVRTCYDRCILR